MLPKTLSIVAFVTVAIFACLNQSHQISHNHSAAHDVSAMKTLQGYKKGDTGEGVRNLRTYLHRYGYLQDRHLNNSTVDPNLFDEDVEFAVKTYQVNFNLNPTGVLDEATVSLMGRPRCGVPDIIDGKTRMNAGKGYHLSYKFFPGEPKWRKTRLTWAIKPGTRRDVIEPMRDFAMMIWPSFVPQFEFIFQDENVAGADIVVSFEKIDGPWNVLALAESPPGGHLEFDQDEDWVYGAVPAKLDMGTIGLHEMGHILGLDHSSDETAVMWPYIKVGEINYPSYDDWLGIRTLYPT